MITRVQFSMVFVCFLIMHVNGQPINLEFSFSAVDGASWVQLDSIRAVNRTQGGDTVLVWPDTTLSLLLLPGDLMLFIGYSSYIVVDTSKTSYFGTEVSTCTPTTYSYVTQSGILDTPVNNCSYTFQFATNIPCPGLPSITYAGKSYHTIQVFSQCWLNENLDVGTMVPGEQGMTDNQMIEKYCYDDDPDNCEFYGGLYQWDEAMLYTTVEGVQGICPDGWHIPTDEELKLLEGSTDHAHGIGDPQWDITLDYRGFDVGLNLKDSTSWLTGGGGLDLYGFSALCNGNRGDFGNFTGLYEHAIIWASTQLTDIHALDRSIGYNNTQSYYYNAKKNNGNGVRCLRDETYER